MITATLKSKLHEDICLQLNVLNHPLTYLCDCGFGSDLTVKDCRDTAAIFVSHTHIDHFVNFGQVMRHQLAIGRRVIVCGPAGLAQHVQHALLAFNWNLLVYDDQAVSYEVREVHPDGRIRRFHLVTPTWVLAPLPDLEGPEVYRDEAFAVTTAILDHGVDCIAYLFACHSKVKVRADQCPYRPGKWMAELKAAFEESDGERLIIVDGVTAIAAKDLFQYLEVEPGFRVAYVMDHAATETNFERIRGLCEHADEVYIEAYYSMDDAEMALKNKHSMAGMSGKVLREAGVKKAVPIHFSRRYQDPEGQAKLFSEFATAFEG
ncbi:MAG: peptidase [Bacteroidetes bacterium]|nr:peptidase [Bacteroidota bacterium]